MGYGLNGPGSIPGSAIFFLFSTASTPTQGPLSLLSNGYWELKKNININ
jgi:hypothetical protein